MSCAIWPEALKIPCHCHFSNCRQETNLYTAISIQETPNTCTIHSIDWYMCMEKEVVNMHIIGSCEVTDARQLGELLNELFDSTVTRFCLFDN